MRQKLASITSSIKYGPHLRTVFDGRVRYLKGQHFANDGALLDADDSYADPEAKIDGSLLRESQVILAGKGNRHFAWAYRPEAGPCVASSLFYVMTVRPELALPRYLALVLNTTSRGRALKAVAKGASVPVIPKRELLHLTVPVPPLERQRQLIHLKELQNRRGRLRREIIRLHTLLDNHRLEHLLDA